MKLIKQSGAFTLVEILIAVAIMTLVTGIALVGVNVNRNRQTLLTGAETVKAALQQVQTYAKHPRSQDFRPLYYVIRFNTSHSFDMRVQRDENNDGTVDTVDIIAENISIHPAIIDTLTVTLPSDPTDPIPIDLTFRPVIGYKIGDPSQIVVRQPIDALLEEIDARFNFKGDLGHAYSKLPGRSYPHLLISNGGAKIEIEMQDS